MSGLEKLNQKCLIKTLNNLFSILMRVFDAKCPDGKSENLRQLLDRLDHNGQLFKL